MIPYNKQETPASTCWEHCLLRERCCLSPDILCPLSVDVTLPSQIATDMQMQRCCFIVPVTVELSCSAKGAA